MSTTEQTLNVNTRRRLIFLLRELLTGSTWDYCRAALTAYETTRKQRQKANRKANQALRKKWSD